MISVRVIALIPTIHKLTYYIVITNKLRIKNIYQISVINHNTYYNILHKVEFEVVFQYFKDRVTTTRI